MGLFRKKNCGVCGGKIGLLGNRKLADADMCKDCASLLSPYLTGRRRTTLAEIKEHLAYREENKKAVADFNVTKTIGDRTKLLVDEQKSNFIVTSSSSWQRANPDVIPLSSVTGCDTEIAEEKTELTTKDAEGNEVSYTPPRYRSDYDFYVKIHLNSPWFDEVNFKVNSNSIDRYGSVSYREAERQMLEIRDVLLQSQEQVLDKERMANAPKTAKTCPSCGATTIPDQNNRCEFCGGAVE